MANTRQFPWAEYNSGALTPARRQELLAAVETGPCYITGGFSLELEGLGGILRTPSDGTAKPYGIQYLRNRPNP
jgi:hypothetical protein